MDDKYTPGAYGKVFDVSDKLVKKVFHKDNNVSLNYWEVGILKLLKNEKNIVKIHDVEDDISSFQMEKMENSLSEIFTLVSPFDFVDMIPEFLFQMNSAIDSLQKYNIVHFDIRPDNILVDRKSDRLIFKLCDFGLSTLVHTAHPECRGVYRYAPPEVLSRKITDRNVFLKYDYWSVGIVVIEGLNRKALGLTDPNFAKYINEDKMRKYEAQMKGEKYDEEDVKNEDEWSRKYILMRIMDSIHDGHLSVKDMVETLVYDCIDSISLKKIEKLLMIDHVERSFCYGIYLKCPGEENSLNLHNNIFSEYNDRKFITAYYYFWNFKNDYQSFVLALELFTRLWKNEKYIDNLDVLTNAIICFTNILTLYYPHPHLHEINLKNINAMLKEIDYNFLNPNILSVLARIENKHSEIFKKSEYLQYAINTDKISMWYNDICGSKIRYPYELDLKYTFNLRELSDEEVHIRTKYIKSIISWELEYIGTYFSVINKIDHFLSKRSEKSGGETLDKMDVINITEAVLNYDSLYVREIDENIKKEIDYHISPVNTLSYLIKWKNNLHMNVLFLLFCTLFDYKICNLPKHILVGKCKYTSVIFNSGNIIDIMKKDKIVNSIVGCFVKYNEYIPNYIFDKQYIDEMKASMNKKLIDNMNINIS